MVVEARMRIRHRGCWTQRLTHEHVTVIGGDRQNIVSVMHGRTPADVDAYLEARAHDTDTPVVVDRQPASVVLRCMPVDSGIIAAVFSMGCTILWPAVYTKGTEAYTILAPTRRRLNALVERLEEMGEVTLERVAEVGPSAITVNVPLGELTNDLTPRQLAVLRRAIEHGYYESPRQTTTIALARAFDLSRSTFQEHLRKAEQRVLHRFGNLLASHPELAQMARRRAGRPRGQTTRKVAPRKRAARPGK